MLFILNSGKLYMFNRTLRKSEQLGISVPVVLCCDSEKVKSWAHKQYNGNVLYFHRKAIHMDLIDVADKSNAEIETTAEAVFMSRASFIVRTFMNGFTNISLHMCPFVKSSELLDTTY